MAKLRITWIKSDIGYVKQQRRTLRALGFHRLNETVEHEDSPSVRGMIAKVSHLVSAEVIGDGTR
ncbi:MAG: 50S ribosomal protein L30 [Dehalococcoidia bacterium]|nr:50S ribosomal protein L30 [Dehalococcoidia bacterium]